MMDVDVVQELYSLSKAQLEVLLKLLELLTTVYKNKHENYKAGIVDSKTFFEQNEPVVTTNFLVPDEIISNDDKNKKYRDKFNALLKQAGVAVVTRGTDKIVKDGKDIEGSFTVFMCSAKKQENLSYVVSEYLRWKAMEQAKEVSKSQEVGGETEQELLAIQERNKKIEELYQVETKDGIKAEVPYNMFSQKDKAAISTAVRDMIYQEPHFSKRNLKTIMDKTNEEFTGNDIVIGDNNKTLIQIIDECEIRKEMTPEDRRKLLAEKIKAEIGSDSDKNFISLNHNKGIFFKDNNNNLVMIDLMSMKLRVTKNESINGKPLHTFMQRLIVEAKKHIQDRNEILDTLIAGKEFSREKMQFMKALSEKTILVEESMDAAGQSSLRARNDSEAEKNYFAVWNYMTSKEANVFDVTDKDRALVSAIQNEAFDKRMVMENHIDAESCWIIADAIQNELDSNIIDHLFSKEINYEDRKLIVDISKEAKERNITYSIDELNGYCREAKGKIEKIQYLNATDKIIPDREKKGLHKDIDNKKEKHLQKKMDFFKGQKKSKNRSAER